MTLGPLLLSYYAAQNTRAIGRKYTALTGYLSMRNIFGEKYEMELVLPRYHRRNIVKVVIKTFRAHFLNPSRVASNFPNHVIV